MIEFFNYFFNEKVKAKKPCNHGDIFLLDSENSCNKHYIFLCTLSLEPDISKLTSCFPFQIQSFRKKNETITVFETELLIEVQAVLKRQNRINNSHSSYLAHFANQKDKGMNVGVHPSLRQG